MIGTLLLTTSIFSTVSAEQRTIEADGKYNFGDGENTDVAKERAKVEAMRNASLQASVYVESVSKMIDHVIDEDIVKMISANVLKLQGEPIFKREVTDDGQAYMIRCHVKVLVDDDNIAEYIARDKEDLKKSTERDRDYENEIERLNHEIERLKHEESEAKNEVERSKILLKIQQNDAEFLASQYFDRGNKEMNERNYSSAIESYTKTVRLNPNFAEVHLSIGHAHCGLADEYFKQEEYVLYQMELNEAIANYSKAIELDSTYSNAYVNRGLCYNLLSQNDLAIADFNSVIKLNPNNNLARFLIDQLQKGE